MDAHGWIVSVVADVEDPQGTVHRGLLESLVLVDMEPLGLATDHLPLSPEPFAAWDDNVDMFSFLHAITADVMTVIGYDGTVTTSRKGQHQEMLQRALEAVAEDLDGFAAPKLGRVKSEISKLGSAWPKEDMQLGQAMKYIIAWRAVDQEALEESRFFSVAHLLEATNEIDSSLALAQGAFYKQAKQQLRSLLELVVMPLHFCIDRASFREWRDGNYRIPRFRGPGGLLGQLIARSLLSEQTANDIGDLYGRLSGSIHNEEKELAFSGVLRGENPVSGFSIERLHEWAELCAATLDVAIRTVIATMDAWDANRPADPFCANCHNETEFSMVAERFGQELYDKITCAVCHTTIVRSLRLADPATEVKSIIPGLKFRLISPEEMSVGEMELSSGQMNVSVEHEPE
jgi:hypothetical protein